MSHAEGVDALWSVKREPVVLPHLTEVEVQREVHLHFGQVADAQHEHRDAHVHRLPCTQRSVFFFILKSGHSGTQTSGLVVIIIIAAHF